MQKKFKNYIWAFLATSIALPGIALADATDSKVTIKLPIPGLKAVTDNAYLTFNNIFSLIFGMAVALAVLSLIANGIRYVVAFGNEQQVEKAKNGVFYSILGFVILALAYTITATINYILAP